MQISKITYVTPKLFFKASSCPKERVLNIKNDYTHYSQSDAFDCDRTDFEEADKRLKAHVEKLEARDDFARCDKSDDFDCGKTQN